MTSQKILPFPCALDNNSKEKHLSDIMEKKIVHIFHSTECVPSQFSQRIQSGKRKDMVERNNNRKKELLYRARDTQYTEPQGKIVSSRYLIDMEQTLHNVGKFQRHHHHNTTRDSLCAWKLHVFMSLVTRKRGLSRNFVAILITNFKFFIASYNYMRSEPHYLK